MSLKDQLKSLVILFFTAQVFATISCPTDSYSVINNSSEAGYKIEYCAIDHMGEFTKHGPEIITDINGDVVQENNYELGKLVVDIKEKNIAKYNSDIEDATNIAQELLKTLLQFKEQNPVNKQFRVDGCQDYRKKWAMTFLQTKDASFKYSYQKNCDIEGEIRATKSGQIFAKLDLRNIEKFKKLDTKIAYQITLQVEPEVLLQIESGELLDKGQTKTLFTGDYKIVVDPFNSKLISKDFGGNLNFHYIFGKSVDYQTKIKITNIGD